MIAKFTRRGIGQTLGDCFHVDEVETIDAQAAFDVGQGGVIVGGHLHVGASPQIHGQWIKVGHGNFDLMHFCFQGTGNIATAMPPAGGA